MFTLEQIEKAHAKVKSGADFPQYIRELFSLGILEYSIYVNDGHAEYIGERAYTLCSKAQYVVLPVADKVNREQFVLHLKVHQRGETNYLSFCQDSAEAGVNKWTVDILANTCTYYDKSNNFILKEKISI